MISISEHLCILPQSFGPSLFSDGAWMPSNIAIKPTTSVQGVGYSCPLTTDHLEQHPKWCGLRVLPTLLGTCHREIQWQLRNRAAQPPEAPHPQRERLALGMGHDILRCVYWVPQVLRTLAPPQIPSPNLQGQLWACCILSLVIRNHWWRGGGLGLVWASAYAKGSVPRPRPV